MFACVLNPINKTLLCNNLLRRTLCSHVYDNFSIVYDSNGNPNEVLKGQHSSLDDTLNNNEVLVKMRVSPVNPSDINIIQGVYPVKLPIPGIAGKEGFGEIVGVGPNVTNLSVGDLVIPDNTPWGAWTNFVKAPESDFYKCPQDASPVTASMMMVNMCTAYRMLMDFEQLSAGDVVVQNAANSAAGQCVIQIAKARGINTLNIIRNRQNLLETVDHLRSIGATHVVTEDFVRSPNMKELLSSIPQPKLALNCVGGKSASGLLKLLQGHGTMVTYGGMSLSPVSIPTSVFIFQKISLKGFWMSKWHLTHKNTVERSHMFNELFELSKTGKLKPPQYRSVPLKDFKSAVARAMESGTEKQVLQIA